MHSIVKTALAAMSSIKKPQRRFILGLLMVLTVYQGRANFRNMSRYSGMSEKCFSRWYGQPFDFKGFNSLLLKQNLPESTSFIAAIDASLACLNVLKIEDRLEKNHSEASVISIASWKRRKFNENFMGRLFDELGISLTCQKVTTIFNRYSGYGAIAV